MSDGTNQEPDNAGGDETPENTGANTRAGGGHGSGGGGGGAHGVGVSTGGWEGGCYFSDKAVITTVTRQWYAPIYNQHLYKEISSTDNAKGWQGISTPWGYFNFNYYASHFSPQDWQRLINEYKKWRPKAMHVKVYNLQIKQIVNLGADTLYNNDLTAGVHIFCDGSHQFPYAQHPWDMYNLPELPNEIYKLPQYAYYQQPKNLVDDNTSNAASIQGVANTLKKAAPLYMLEHASHEVLRTGEQTSFNFTFDCEWVHNDRTYAPPQANCNPLIPTRRFYTIWNSTNNNYYIGRYDPYNKPSNWFPGPAITPIGTRYTTNNPENAKGPIVTTYQPPGTKTAGGTNIEAAVIKKPTDAEIAKQGYSTTPVNQACSGVDLPTLNMQTQNAPLDTVPARGFDIDMARWGNVWTADDLQERYLDQEGVWLFPNQVWNESPLCRTNAIWDKIPRTDKQSLMSSADGTIPMHHPPGTIFVKVAKIPIPTENNTDSYLNLYVTGQVTCQILWETERYQTKNWRPEIRATANEFSTNVYNVDANGTYNYSQRSWDNMTSKMGINRVS
ncbi:VP2 [Squirrel bocaparvovirus]|nr:VP2 [Squirrel bocaparvovirus]